MSIFHQLDAPIDGVSFYRAPDRVEPGESFDLAVETQCSDPAEGCTGQPISFYIDGEFWMQTTGADIDPADDGTAFDGLVGVQFDDPGYYTLRVEVAGNSDTHVLAVGRDPDNVPGDTTTSGTSNLTKAVGVLGLLAVGGKILGGGEE